ncbi:hypothetical protein [Mycoplasma procyoni]|uniref:hypothetical protein n=1 Tax=Mycoplasma procyoni TaxID=568784 RepID=UPI00197BF150|nr:hypothetical protein [Mycoplasma procyoni]MBN3534535.1 hypothetical protein [Mycoplasma procyoni]
MQKKGSFWPFFAFFKKTIYVFKNRSKIIKDLIAFKSKRGKKLKEKIREFRDLINIYLVIYFLVFFIFLILTIWNYSLILGWLFSLVSVSYAFFTKVMFAAVVTKNVKPDMTRISRKKKVANMLIIFLYIFALLFQGLLIAAMVFINKSWNGAVSFLWPVNLISYIVGVSLILPAVLINWLINYIKEKKDESTRSTE